MSNILLNQPANRQGIVGVLLAAGSSSRFGTPKLLHPLDDGTRLGVKSALNLIEALPWAVAVVSPQRPLLKSLLEAAGLQVLTCAAAELGMGESLAYAIRHTPHAAGWVVALADMPFIQPNTIKQVMRRLAGGSALRCRRMTAAAAIRSALPAIITTSWPSSAATQVPAPSSNGMPPPHSWCRCVTPAC